MRDDDGRRDWLSLLVGSAIVVLSVAYFVGVQVHDLGFGLIAGFVFVAVGGSVAVVARLRAERRLASVDAGPLAVNAVLDLSCLPGGWPAIARAALRPLANKNAGMRVLLTVSDGYLVVERRLGRTGRTPFMARLPLPSIEKIRVRRSWRTMNGSSLTFALASGEELRVDMRVGSGPAERVAHLFREAVSHTPLDSSWHCGGIEVTSPVP